MNSAAPAGIAPIGWSIALHAVIVGLLYLGLSVPRPEPVLITLPIEAVVMDQAVLQAASLQRRSDERREAEQQRREEAAVEARKIEETRLEQQELERRNAEQQQRLVAEKSAQQKAKAAADAKRTAEVQKQRTAQDARLRQEREAELRARLAAEEERTSSGFQSLKASYVQAIQAHVEHHWFEPPGTGQGLTCTVYLMQIPGGEVVGMRFGNCNGNTAVRQSIETAVRNASPLPAPPEPALFEREIRLIFTPKASGR